MRFRARALYNPLASCQDEMERRDFSLTSRFKRCHFMDAMHGAFQHGNL